MRYSRSVLIATITLLAIAPSNQAQTGQTRSRSETSSTGATDRYRLNRFQLVPTETTNSMPPRSGRGSDRCKSSLHDPAVSRVQHQAPAEMPPLPVFEMAQADLLDDILDAEPADQNEMDVDAFDEILPAEPESVEPVPTPSSPRSTSPSPSSRQRSLKLLDDKSSNRGDARTSPRGAGYESPDDIKPQPPAQRPYLANQPFTLAGILNDEDDYIDCLCEQEFCQLMWQCAGGRNMSQYQRWQRDFSRNWGTYFPGSGGGSGSQNSMMRCWQCSARLNQQQMQGGQACPHCQSTMPGPPGTYMQHGPVTMDGWQSTPTRATPPGGWQMPSSDPGNQPVK